VAQIIACLTKLGYSTSVSHDGGTERQCFFDLCKTVQVRPATTEIIASVPGGLVLTVDVPDAGGAADKYLRYPDTVQLTARRAAARCAEIS